MSLRSHEAIVKSIETDGFSVVELHHKLGKALEHRPGVLFTGDHKFNVDDRPWEGLSLDARPNLDCADRLQEFAAQRRAEMGEERWAELDGEWE